MLNWKWFCGCFASHFSLTVTLWRAIGLWFRIYIPLIDRRARVKNKRNLFCVRRAPLFCRVRMILHFKALSQHALRTFYRLFIFSQHFKKTFQCDFFLPAFSFVSRVQSVNLSRIWSFTFRCALWNRKREASWKKFFISASLGEQRQRHKTHVEIRERVLRKLHVLFSCTCFS